MAKIRHLAIRTEDTGKLASFYVDVFDMEVIHKTKEEGGTIFLSDGYLIWPSSPIKIKTRPMGCTTSASRSKTARPSSKR